MKPAFTLIELLVVMALIALLAIPSILGIAGIRSNQALRGSVDNLIIVLQRAHIYARENKGNVAWGVKCNDEISYSLVSGTMAVPKLAADYSLNGPIKFKNGCDWVNVWFERGSGSTAESNSIAVISNTGKEARVNISKDGVVGEGP